MGAGFSYLGSFDGVGDDGLLKWLAASRPYKALPGPPVIKFVRDARERTAAIRASAHFLADHVVVVDEGLADARHAYPGQWAGHGDRGAGGNRDPEKRRHKR